MDGQALDGEGPERAGSLLSQMMFTGRSFSGRERNCFFLNTGDTPAAQGRFANISAVSGLDFPDDARAVALVDWDHDGDLDMWISNRNAPRLRLMRNELPTGNHFLMLRLQGNGKTTNRDAIGARVEVVFANADSKNPHPKSIKTLRAGEGFLAQSSKWIHFGLGKTDTVKMVTVRWPGGEVEQFTGINANHRYRLIQGSGVAQDITQSPRKTCLIPSTQKVPPASQVARIPLVELLPVPHFTYTDFGGRNNDLKRKSGRLLLVNLWAGWCTPCETELNEFSQRYNELKAKGIDVLALSIDGMGDDPSTKADAERLVAKLKPPFPVGLANARVIASFQEPEFFVGFGPKVFSFKRGNTEYGLKAIPLGGYVKIPGMDESEDTTGYASSELFHNAKWTTKFYIAISGILVNFITAWLILFTILSTNGVNVPTLEIANTGDSVQGNFNSPSVAAGLIPGPADTDVSAPHPRHWAQKVKWSDLVRTPVT